MTKEVLEILQALKGTFSTSPPWLMIPIAVGMFIIWCLFKAASIKGDFKFRKTRRDKSSEITEDLAKWEKDSPEHTFFSKLRDDHDFAHHAGWFIRGKKRDVLIRVFNTKENELSVMALQSAAGHLDFDKDDKLKRQLSIIDKFAYSWAVFSSWVLSLGLVVLICLYFYQSHSNPELSTAEIVIWITTMLITTGLIVVFAMIRMPYVWAKKVSEMNFSYEE